MNAKLFCNQLCLNVPLQYLSIYILSNDDDGSMTLWWCCSWGTKLLHQVHPQYGSMNAVPTHTDTIGTLKVSLSPISCNIPAHQMCFLPPTIDYFFFWHFSVISLTEHQRCVRLWSKFIFSWYMAVLMCSLDLRGQYHLEMSQIWGLMHPCMSFCIL